MGDDIANHDDDQTPSRLYRSLAWVVTLLTPVVLVLTALRLMLLPAFLHLEYRTPDFPPDRYGFTWEERLYWAKLAQEFLVNREGIEFLGDLRFENGEPVYNERELQHMVDVKNVVGVALNIWYLSLAALLGLGIWAWRGAWLDDYRLGLARGGWLTVLLLGSSIVIVLLSFGVFFVAFHNVFFAPGTWTFDWSDTLIRITPERFWRDVFIWVGVFSLGTGLALALGLRRR
jgi:integral membrane protein (TIGR01906 family)